MRVDSGRLVFSPTDLANFLACQHKTTLDLQVVRGERERPADEDPLAALLRKRGDDHERRYVDRLRAQGLSILDLTYVRAARLSSADAVSRTRDALASGADVIVQAPLGNDRWFGYADLLVKVRPGAYEVHDTKLARETRATAVLQLCVYTELLAELLGDTPERFHIVTPAQHHSFRMAEVAAYYRLVQGRLESFPQDSGDPTNTYPEPTDHCDVCRWWTVCHAQRRKDDHIQFVANLGGRHRRELSTHGLTTMGQLAAWHVPQDFVPAHGARDTFVKLQDQAALQVAQRTLGVPQFTRLPLVPHVAPDGTGLPLRGLKRLPEPSRGDLFLDLEGDPFGRHALGGEAGEGAREYLFGLGQLDDRGEFRYQAWWAWSDAEEQLAFEAVVDEIVRAIDADPNAHVYHYAPYEPTAFKRLSGRYATRAESLDTLLRAGRFVDLYAVVRESIRAGIESYSIKELEPFYGFSRDIDLRKAGQERQAIEIALESGDVSAITREILEAVEGYNRDDVRSTWRLQHWLEARRDDAIAEGHDLPRPIVTDGTAPESVGEREARVRALRERLLTTIPNDAQHATTPNDTQRPTIPNDTQRATTPNDTQRPTIPNDTQRATTPNDTQRHLTSYLLDWHRRENRSEWWEFYRLVELGADELRDERKAVAGLTFVGCLGPFMSETTGKPTRSVVDRYTYPPQECDIRTRDRLKLTDGKDWGEVVAIDRHARLLDVKVGPGRAGQRPEAAFAHHVVSPEAIEDALFAIGTELADGMASPLALSLLERRPPAFRDVPELLTYLRGATEPPDSGTELRNFGTEPQDLSTSKPRNLGSVLAIQGPPGTGKTHRAAVMICDLAGAGRTVGVTAHSHAVVTNLLRAVQNEALRRGARVPILQIKNQGEFGAEAPMLVGGTAWHWCSAAARPVDVLFVDEAGQMALANVLACTPMATTIVLLGDPQQLDQPTKGIHPDGVGVSALEHWLGGAKVMPSELGEFLGVTWRLNPGICAFTSECFYEGRLTAKSGLEQQALSGSARFTGSGLRTVLVSHDGNRHASDEEVREVVRIVEELLSPDAHWVDQTGKPHRMQASDIRIVAPYNAQVSRIEESLQAIAPVPVGTVDRFQGQEAPVVIYSMATSRPEDAPRGLGFLYSLNRFNVATSRARCLCILVASPHLFEPDCQTPRHMQLANALCRYRELATSG